MSATDLIHLIELLAPSVVAGVLLIMLLRRLGVPIPAQLLKRLGLVGLALLACLVGVHALGERSLKTFFVAWALGGLPVYLVWRWIVNAPVREAERERLRQARSQERRPAAPQGGGSAQSQAPSSNAPTRNLP